MLAFILTFTPAVAVAGLGKVGGGDVASISIMHPSPMRTKTENKTRGWHATTLDAKPGRRLRTY